MMTMIMMIVSMMMINDDVVNIMSVMVKAIKMDQINKLKDG